MLQAVKKNLSEATTAIFAAAVADYRPVEAAAQKIKKTGGEINLRLEPNPDISGHRRGQKKASTHRRLCRGTDNVAGNARKKLQAKNADLIVANDVTAEGAGFDVDTNVVTLFARDGRDLPLPRMSKREVAHRILDEVLRLSASVKPPIGRLIVPMPENAATTLQEKITQRLRFYEDLGSTSSIAIAARPRLE